jgi:parallel beta-helix repeat protein
MKIKLDGFVYKITKTARIFGVLGWIAAGIPVSAANYYLSSTTGDDGHSPSQAQNPVTPWQSLERLNQFIPELAPGDSVLLKRGDVFYGTLQLRKSGSPEKPIVFATYGDGALPVITGLSTLTGWESQGSGIYSVAIPRSIGRIQVLTLNGVPQAIGRYPNSDEPNKGYLIPEAIPATNQIRHQVLQMSGNWAGAELVMRKNHWIIDRQKILSQEGGTLTFLPGSDYEPKKGYGFFIQHHRNTLDQHGEWYQDQTNNRLYLCLKQGNPDAVKIEIGSIENLVTTLPNTRHVILHSLHLKGANATALLIRGGSHFRFSSGKIEHSGENAVLAQNMDHLVLEKSEIRNAYNSGIYLRSGNFQATIRENRIANTFLFPGMGQNGDNNGFAIFSVSDADTIARNSIVHCGYVGIGFRGSHTLVKNNLVDSFCLTKGDGGGIYSYTGSSNPGYTQRVITGNIVRNGIGAREGTPLQGTDLPAPAEGIYLDDNAEQVLVTDNTVYGISNKGIYLHNAQHITVRNNLVFDAGYLLFLTDDELGQPLKHLKFSENILIKKEAHQVGMGVRSGSLDFGTIGISDKNHYLDLSGTGISFFTQNTQLKSERFYTYKDWNNLSEWERTTRIAHHRDQTRAVSGTGATASPTLNPTLNGGASCTGGCQLTWGPDRELQIAGTGEISEAKIPLSGYRADIGYEVVFSAASLGEVAMELYLRQNGAPYQKLSASRVVVLGNDQKQVQVNFIPSPYAGATALILKLFQGKQQTILRNMKLVPLSEKSQKHPTDFFVLATNPGGTTKQLPLNGTYTDIFGREYKQTIALAPYQGIFLLKEIE